MLTNFRLRLAFTLVFMPMIWLFTNSKLSAVVTKDTIALDSPKVDWSYLRVKIAGNAKAKDQSNFEWKDLEKQAWQDGFNKLEDYYTKALKDVSDRQKLRLIIKQNTNSLGSIYSATGDVAVLLEGILPEAVRAKLENEGDTEGVSKTAATEKLADLGTKNSAIVLRLKGTVKPLADFSVVSKEGKTLYSQRNVDRAAYSQHLTGRWFVRTSKEHVKRFVGEVPAELTGELEGSNVIVDEQEWTAAVAGNDELIRNARVALVVN